MPATHAATPFLDTPERPSGSDASCAKIIEKDKCRNQVELFSVAVHCSYADVPQMSSFSDSYPMAGAVSIQCVKLSMSCHRFIAKQPITKPVTPFRRNTFKQMAVAVHLAGILTQVIQNSKNVFKSSHSSRSGRKCFKSSCAMGLENKEIAAGVREAGHLIFFLSQSKYNISKIM